MLWFLEGSSLGSAAAVSQCDLNAAWLGGYSRMIANDGRQVRPRKSINDGE
jgi:hypothetical protein